MLKEKTLFENVDKVKSSIEILKDLEPEEGYYLAFSGGKDSVVIKKLAEMSGVKFDAHYSVTTIDPPDLVYFIRDYHKDVKFELPEMNMIHAFVEKGFPIRQARWCCAKYKENGGDGRFVITGVRAAESAKRAKRKKIEVFYKGTGKRYLNLIHDWTDSDVWDFIKEYSVPYCKLYDEGWRRIGCIACPMAPERERKRDLKRYPGYEKLLRKAFRELYDIKLVKNPKAVERWKDSDDMFEWWLTGSGSQEDPDRQYFLNNFS